MDDYQKLSLLATFNFVYAGFTALIYAGLIVVMRFVPTLTPGLGSTESLVFVLIFGAVLVPSIIMNVLSGIFLRQRKFRVYCIVHAGVQCLSFPFGTALGVCTIVVLNDQSVQGVFDLDQRH